ncbi:hypothetical protein A3749_10810 [Oleiphilus sp. HI0078]|nr:hypothetical protein A3749_10810 [Oleiphilus sp. HI0078]
MLIHWLGGVAQYWGWRKTPNGDVYEVNEDPKLNIVRPLMEMKRGLKPLEAVVTAPTITLAGQLVNKLGYHASSRLFLDTAEDLPNIPDSPNSSQVLQAFDVLMKPFKDFPFASNLDKSVLLSGLLSACVRPVLPACPAHAYDAPVQGSGKTLLAECNAILATGEAPDVWPHTSGRDDEETRKRLFTALKSGKRTVVWDNILGVFDSAAMAAFLTSSNFTDRVLGQSKELTVPNKMLLLMTGNNLSLAGDMPRRVLTCRIDPKTDEPYKREFKVCPRSYVLANRQKLVAAALTIIKGWFASSDYENGVTANGRMASFESWDDLVRQPIAWMARSMCVGELVDVMDVIDQAQQSDPEQDALHELLEAIRDRFGGAFFTAKDLVDNSYHFDEKGERITDALKEVAPNANVTSSRGVGKILRYRRERVVKGLCLESRQLKDHYQFRVQKVGDGLSSYAPSLSNGLNGRALN